VPEREFSCSKCGAKLKFQPGTDHLLCPYCGRQNQIESQSPPIEELDYEAALRKFEGQAETVDRVEVTCQACAARVQMADNVSSAKCPFCGTPIVATERTVKLIKPGGVLPFGLDERKAREALGSWIGGRWFAPNDLKRSARVDAGVSGVYMPFWTYDCKATTQYTGQRGDHYYVTESYTTTENGRPVVRTRQVQRTRWSPAAGTVRNVFDDVLVCASRSISVDGLASLAPWDLKALVPYTDEYLSGFKAETYTLQLKDGFGVAREIMAPTIDRTIRADIGGDVQQVSSARSAYNDITYKHMLLPVWVCAYRWNNKAYQILINARTGEVFGERPYSAWKIAMLVAAILVAVLVIVLFARSG